MGRNPWFWLSDGRQAVFGLRGGRGGGGGAGQRRDPVGRVNEFQRRF